MMKRFLTPLLVGAVCGFLPSHSLAEEQAASPKKKFVGWVSNLHPTKPFAMVKELLGVEIGQTVCFFDVPDDSEENLGGEVIDRAAAGKKRLVEIGCGQISLIKGSRILVQVEESLKSKIKKGMRAEATEIDQISPTELRRVRANKRRENAQKKRAEAKLAAKQPGVFAYYIDGGVGGRYYPLPGLQQGQADFLAYLSIAPFLSFTSDSGTHSVAIAPTYRLDFVEDNHTRGDVQLLEYSYSSAPVAFTAGISQVRWGSAYAARVVDIVNQSDYADDPEGLSRLGQPLLRPALVFDRFSLEALIMPFPRERVFPGAEGRTRPPFRIFTRNSQFESEAKKNHIDLGARALVTALSTVDLGISYFYGTGRNPVFIDALTADDTPILIPLYPQVRQTGVDVEASVGPAIVRGEAVSHSSAEEKFSSVLLGSEYFLSQSFSLITEIVKDSRGDKSRGLFQNDLLFGARFSSRDPFLSELLFKQYFDLQHGSLVSRLLAEKHFLTNYRIALDIFVVSQTTADGSDYAALLRRDSYVEIEFGMRL